jgi:hypothetical protein
MAAETLRRVGWSLIAVGLLDIALLVYSTANNLSYGSGFGVAAVVAGIFLLRQSMRTANVVTFLAAFFLPPIIAGTVLDPLVVTVSIATELILVALIVYVFWVYRSLTSPVVMEARRSAGVSARTPRLAFVSGITMAVGWALVIILALVGAK